MANNLLINPSKTYYSWEDTLSGYSTVLIPVATTKVYRTETGIRLDGKDISIKINVGEGHFINSTTCATPEAMMTEVISLLVV